MSLAGSAIKQNVGDLTKWDQWKPDNRKYGWLLIAGATNPPENIDTSQRRSKEEKSGPFLEGTKYDMQIMEEFVKKKSLGNLQNTLRMLDMEKQEVIKRLKKFFEWCKKNEYKPALYYTGHGEVGTGDWCFSDGTLSIIEIEKLLPGGMHYPLIIADCCYSGHWANYCLEKNESEKKNQKDIQFHCLSASPEYSIALDFPNKGGQLTMWMTGNHYWPSVEPLYSGGNRNDYNFDVEIDVVNFISGHIKNTRYFILSQHLMENKYHVIFGRYSTNIYPATVWGKYSSYNEMITAIHDNFWGGRARMSSQLLWIRINLLSLEQQDMAVSKPLSQLTAFRNTGQSPRTI